MHIIPVQYLKKERINNYEKNCNHFIFANSVKNASFLSPPEAPHPPGKTEIYPVGPGMPDSLFGQNSAACQIPHPPLLHMR